MKRIILLAFMLIGSRLFAQEWKVVEWEGKPQSEIRSSLKAWVADYFKSARNVIQLDEVDRIIIKGNNSINEVSETKYGSIPVNYTVHFTIDFQIKDSKYRYIIKDISLKTPLVSFTPESLKLANDESRKTALKYKGNSRQAMESGADAVDRVLDQSNTFLSSLGRDIEAIPSKTKSETETW
ncbi:hypothetical protein QE382_002176 [Sphingobacterium zeae]|uniref:DUF4468 domain-containing protein n=1 Tax=Sphingobacterium zeae TaxID=1776859 RepID=A0ABU0U5G7_9SPHI|nr:DUF4468 domain-containing protein [Sphingobacterium zeae]MDQ1150192.1 hypothetical protein [Sphingobacterium zeae]